MLVDEETISKAPSSDKGPSCESGVVVGAMFGPRDDEIDDVDELEGGSRLEEDDGEIGEGSSRPAIDEVGMSFANLWSECKLQRYKFYRELTWLGQLAQRILVLG
jgi:hypothetical protein